VGNILEDYIASHPKFVKPTKTVAEAIVSAIIMTSRYACMGVTLKDGRSIHVVLRCQRCYNPSRPLL